MKRVKITILFACLLPLGLFAQNLNESVINGLRMGNAELLEVYLKEEVEIILPHQQGTLSKDMASKSLDEFFSQNEVQSFELLHEGSSPSGNYYHIGQLYCIGAEYRVYILNTGEQETSISEIRIEFDD